MLLPSEVIKAKTQVNVGNASSNEIFKEMMRKQGMRSMLIGLDAQLARDASFYAFFFGGYEVFTYMFRTHVPSMPDELNYFLRYVRIVSDEMHIHEMYVHIMYDSHIYIL